MIHTFDTHVAKLVGVHGAVILNNIAYWVNYKRANNANLYQGKSWVYMTAEGFQRYFSYMSLRTIRYSLVALENAGLIKSDILPFFNKNQFDRTKSYTLTEKCEELLKIDLVPLSDQVETNPEIEAVLSEIKIVHNS